MPARELAGMIAWRKTEPPTKARWAKPWGIGSGPPRPAGLFFQKKFTIHASSQVPIRGAGPGDSQDSPGRTRARSIDDPQRLTLALPAAGWGAPGRIRGLCGHGQGAGGSPRPRHFRTVDEGRRAGALTCPPGVRLWVPKGRRKRNQTIISASPNGRRHGMPWRRMARECAERPRASGPDIPSAGSANPAGAGSRRLLSNEPEIEEVVADHHGGGPPSRGGSDPCSRNNDYHSSM